MEQPVEFREIVPLSEIAKQEVIEQFVASLCAGGDWLDALLSAIAAWTVPDESVNGRHYHYLIGTEAFDWLLLAERLALAAPGLIPEDERDKLLFHGILPRALAETEFRDRIGPAKYRAVMNYWYGVRVEEALILAVEHEVRKQRHGLRPEEARLDDAVYEHIYGATRTDLLARFCAERQQSLEHGFSLSDMDEFTYWLFKHRLKRSDRARLASDTRKGIDFLCKFGRGSLIAAQPAEANGPGAADAGTGQQGDATSSTSARAR